MFHERQRQILDLLEEKPQRTVSELQDALKVSRATMRRDIIDLEEMGEVVRLHGRVALPNYLRGESTVFGRGKVAVKEKMEIANRAVELLQPNTTIYIDAGSTCLGFGKLASLRSDLQIFTNNVRLLLEAGMNAAAMTAIGGKFRPASEALIGGLANDWLRQLRFDMAFLGASGLDMLGGASTTDVVEGDVKAFVASRSAKVYLLADSDKWESPAAVTFSTWDRFDGWITDSGLSAQDRKLAIKKGLPLLDAKSARS